jgi:CARDB
MKIIIVYTLLVGVLSYSKPTALVADLAVKEVSYQPLKPKVGDEVVFTYEVTNLGPSEAPKLGYKVTFTIDGEMVGLDAEAGPLAATKSYSYSKEKPYFHLKAKKKGKYPYEVKITMAAGQADPDLKNNVLKGYLIVE